jgi:hypothetical protein
MPARAPEDRPELPMSRPVSRPLSAAPLRQGLLLLFTCLLLALAAAAPALAQKVYARDDLAGEAQRLEERLKREVAVQGARPLAQLIREAEAALGRGEARRALPLANLAAVTDPRSPEGWRLLARAAMAVEARDWREKYELQERAVAAAYLAYQRAAGRPQEAAALAQLGAVFAWREQWRPALTVYRLSLDLAQNAEVQASYEELRDKYGFRITEQKTDADSANPRACFEFSEPLARGRVDYAPFVAVSGARGAEVAVTAEGRQLCVEGLRHGERYGIVLRQGIPSAIAGEVLQKSADYDIYVRDRTPTVRFSGRNYVLPRTGQQGIPLVSVNTERVTLEVLRIGERNLVGAVHSDDFMGQLGSFDAARIARERGQRIWSGSMETKSELNRDVTTAFPVAEAVGKLQPGVYVLTAKPYTPRPAAAPAAEGDEPESYETLASQWFTVSDLGLTAFSGSDGVHVLVRSLADAKPVANAELRLIARNNEVLGTARTDRNGHARFEGGIARGQGGNAPGLVTATLADDHGFLDLKQTAFDLTDRGVKGRAAPRGLDAFVVAERGVYRSGETAHLTTLLRDPAGKAVTGLPLTLIVLRPDGVEYRRQAVEDQGGGGRAFSLPLVASAPSGTWRVRAHVDPRQPAIGETTFLVEDYLPERLEAEVTPRQPRLISGQPAELSVAARYLYGAPGADLAVTAEAQVKVAATSAIPGLEGFTVGVSDEPVEAVQSSLEEPATTDAQGRATIGLPLQEPATNQPLEAVITLSISENGGRGISREVTLPILPRGHRVGVRKTFQEGALADGGTATFEVVLAGGDGRRLARPGVKWTLSRINRSYQWFYQDGSWNYEATKSTRRVADGEVSVSDSAPATLAMPVQWGSYRLDVAAPGLEGAETSVSFSVGTEAERSADTPDVLDVAVNRTALAAGETLEVRLAPRFAGQATLAIVSDRLHALEVVDVPLAGTTLRLPVKAEWGTSAYAVVLAHRPLDEQAKRMPGRALGLAWFSVDRAARSLAVTLDTPPLVRPRGTLDIPLRIAGLAAGEEAFVTVAAVDVGILNLTRYQAPDPTEHYFGQKQLGAEVRDLYGQLIDGMQGTRGQVRSGGDATGATTSGDKPTQEPLARYSGVVKAGPDGLARISFDLPAFNGTARVMAMAWTKDRTGQASKDVIIRDPVVAQATVPRFLAIGDRSRFFVEINNVEGEAGAYTLDLDARGPVVLPAAATQQTVTLARGQKQGITIPVTAAGIGLASFDLRLTGPGGLDLTQQVRLRVSPSSQTIANRTVRPLEGNGGQLVLSSDLLGGLLPGSGVVSVAVSPFASLDVPALLKALDRYPYGCTEQTVSRAMPLLYLNRLASLEQLAMDQPAEERLAQAVERVMARQGANGSFGLWSIGGEDLWLDAFVTDFLTRARERNVAVPAVGFGLALDRLRNAVANAGDIRKEEAEGIAYAIHVLARNGRPVMGDLRYLADNKLAAFASPFAKAQIGAALAQLGDRGRARTAFAAATTALQAARDDGTFRADYGSRLRDAVGVLTLLAESGSERAEITRVVAVVEEARNAQRFTSTQEQTWMVLAAQALSREAEAQAITVDGAPVRGAFYRSIPAARLEQGPVTIANPGAGALRATITVAGVPMAPEAALNRGYQVQRSLHSFKGQTIDPAQLKQNERYIVVLRVTEPATTAARLLLVDPLPAGLEIENPSLTEGANTEALAWLKQEVTPVHTEARDDRYVAAFDRAAGQPASFMVAYVVRAVSPGRYVHPAAFAEDMYRPERFGRTAFGSAEVSAAR